MRTTQRIVRAALRLAGLAVPAFTMAGAVEPPGHVRFADVVLGTGIRVRYAASGDSLGEPLIFLHGYTDSWFSFSEILPRLDPRYRAYAIDQRGHGSSERPDSGFTMRHFASDVVAFMDAMKLPRVTLVGHSMGSLVAREVAALAPERITRLVLVGAPATGNNGSVREFRDALHAMGDSIPESFVHDFQASTVHKPIPPQFLAGAVRESRRVPPRVWRAVLDGIVDPRSLGALNAAAFPTLLVWGAQDQYFPRPEQEQLLRVIPNARLLVYDSTGHALHWERPAEFVRDLEAFLRH